MIKSILYIRLRKYNKKKNSSTYRIIITHKNKGPKSIIVDSIGYYNPMKLEKQFFVDTSKLAYWLNRGAKVSSKVSFLTGYLGLSDDII